MLHVVHKRSLTGILTGMCHLPTSIHNLYETSQSLEKIILYFDLFNKSKNGWNLKQAICL